MTGGSGFKACSKANQGRKTQVHTGRPLDAGGLLLPAAFPALIPAGGQASVSQTPPQTLASGRLSSLRMSRDPKHLVDTGELLPPLRAGSRLP